MLTKMTFRTKALLLVVLFSAILLSLVGSFNYSAAQHIIMKALQDKAHAEVQSSAGNLSAWIGARRAEIEVMSRTNIVRFGTAEERLDYVRKETQRTGSPYLTIGFVDLNGMTQLSDGRIIDISKEPTFEEAVKGHTVVSDPFIGQYSGHSIIEIQVPVYDERSLVVGLLDAVVPSERVRDGYLSFRVARTDKVFLYNADTTIIEADAAGQDWVGRQLDSRQLPFLKASYDMSHKEFGYSELPGESGRSVVIYAAVEGTAWHIGLYVPLAEIREPLAALKWRTAISIVLAELLTVTAYYLLSATVVSRLRKVLDVTEAASAGHFDVDAVEERQRSGDIIDRLTHSVNEMRLHLRDMFGRLEAVINQNLFAFIVADENCQIVFFSQAAERMLGYKAEEVVGRESLLLFIAPEDLEAEAHKLSVSLRREVKPDLDVLHELRRMQFSYEREWTFRRKDGSRVQVMHSSTGIRDNEGRFIGVAGIVRDITQQKQVEKLRGQQLEVMEAAKDLIASFDDKGRLIYMNPAGWRMLGMHRGPGERPPEAVPVSLIAQLFDGVDADRQLDSWESEELLTTADGSRIHVSKIVVAHRHDKKSETFYSCIARDITEQKRVLGELEQAKREAEAANYAKSQFLARISHEIRTPLAGIMGLIGLLQKTPLSPLQQDYLDKSRSSSEALLSIINDILEFAKVEAGKIELSEISFSPARLLHKISDLLGIFVGGKERFEFIIDAPQRLPAELIGDPLRLEQALINLCINAIKFTDAGHVRLRVELPRGEAAEGEKLAIRFAVEDTGIGMSEQQLRNLFKPFVQADKTTSRKYGGSGLGLVIVKSLVELMGGSIEVDSRLGEGSVFSFTLHLTVVQTAHRESLTVADEEGLAVWVVEDSPLMSERLCAELEGMGVSTIPFPSWKTAYERLCRAGIGALPNALLLDFEAPDMYGEETWRAFHRMAEQNGIGTIAFTTAYGRDELLKLPAADRPNAIIVKPVDRYGIFLAMNAALKQENGGANGIAPLLLAAGEPPGMKGTILLAEDNKINQLVAIEQLREWGYAAEVAETGTEVLQKLEQDGGRWDMILMDIHMPDMDGDEAARLIRAEAKYDRLPIIALTANVIREDHERYRDIGINDVLTKPIQPELLRGMIAKWISVGGERRIESEKEAAAARAAYEPIMSHEESVPLAVPGLDEAAALERVGGKRDILNHMLKIFVQDYSDYGERLDAVLKSGDFGTAKRMAHTLKGVAGNLSAAELAEAADKLDKLLKEPAATRGMQAIAKAAEEVQQVLEPILLALTEGKTGDFDRNS